MIRIAKETGLIIFCTLFFGSVFTQNQFPELKKKFNEDGTQYIKCFVLGQFWTRYTEMNPGTTLNNYKNPSSFDIGLRRIRFNVWTQLNRRLFFYAQFGQNNFSSTSKLYTGSFIHDAVGEYKLIDKAISIGTGLTGWSGLARYAAPSVGSILGFDAPLYQQVTNGINDQFLRKLSIYAKGKIQKLDYRLIVTKPMLAANSSVPIGVLNSNNATFSLKPPKIQTQGYFNYQFLDQEDNTLGYMTGSYLGRKKMFNVGAGWIQQNDALWHLENINDTINDNMTLFGADVFLELPLSEKNNTFTTYIAFTEYLMGKNYIRNLGVMNPANTMDGNGSFSGPGNSLPLIGTGQTIFTQLAYKFKDNLFKNNCSLQVYSNMQYSKFEALKDPMILLEGGVNFLLTGDHHGKLSLGYQSRPIFTFQNGIELKETSRKGMLVLQYQISF